MNETSEKQLEKIIKIEKKQVLLTRYITTIGKLILFLFPIILVIITILTIFSTGDPAATTFDPQELDNPVLTALYLIILGLYFINSLLLLLGAFMTNQALDLRIQYERKRGRPIDCLDGFTMLTNNVLRVVKLLQIIAIVCITSVVLFFIMLFLGNLTLGYAAMSTALVGLGLAFLIRSLNLNMHDVNGLQDFFKPTTHQIFLDNLFAEILANHLDPVTYLKWDELVNGLEEILNPTFVKQIKEQEQDELPITFALEKIFFLYYLHYQDVLTNQQLEQEFKEVINIDSENFDIEKGFFMEGNWYFSAMDIYKLFDFIKQYNPGFFNIIDRLQLELADNISRIAKDPIYMDSSAQEIVFNNGQANIMVFLYNNSPEEKTYRLRIEAPGFEPKTTLLNLEVEGRGSFIIPDKPIPLTSNNDTDITKVLSIMLENGDTAWLTLEPRKKGEQTIQIFLENEEGKIIEGKTRNIIVTANTKDKMKKLSSLISVISGFAIALSRMLPSLLS
ncbi:MAG: membrane protein of unknown function [Promethearchaeota archaeon]|nr:MAG: membrane protein of unknown function [Candidatus Lokiarchaeota archaeon]